MNPAFLIGSLTLITVASLYLLIQIRLHYPVYSVVMILVLASVAGALFNILHLPGASELLLLSFAGTFLGSVLLVWRALKNRQDQILLNKLFAGLILLFQIVAAFVWPLDAGKTGLLNYPLAAIIGTILINKQYEHAGERNILILFLMQGILYILIEVMKFV